MFEWREGSYEFQLARPPEPRVTITLPMGDLILEGMLRASTLPVLEAELPPDDQPRPRRRTRRSSSTPWGSVRRRPHLLSLADGTKAVARPRRALRHAAARRAGVPSGLPRDARAGRGEAGPRLHAPHGLHVDHPWDPPLSLSELTISLFSRRGRAVTLATLGRRRCRASAMRQRARARSGNDEGVGGRDLEQPSSPPGPRRSTAVPASWQRERTARRCVPDGFTARKLLDARPREFGLRCDESRQGPASARFPSPPGARGRRPCGSRRPLPRTPSSRRMRAFHGGAKTRETMSAWTTPANSPPTCSVSSAASTARWPTSSSPSPTSTTAGCG